MSTAVRVHASAPVDAVVTETDLGSGRRVDVTLRNGGRSAVTLDRAEVRICWMPGLVLEHGYQSWSVVRVASPSDVRPERAELPDWVRGCHFANPAVAGHVVSGDQFLVTDMGVAGFLGGNRHFGVVEARPGGVVAVALLDGAVLEAGAERELEPLWWCEGDPGSGYSQYASHWGALAGARLPRPSVFGWCSWYEYFDRVTPGDVRANLTLACEHGVRLVQIDDGYQAAIGDWLATNGSWPDGIAAMAGEIRSRGAQAGIWTAPFLVGENSKAFAEHPDWTTTHASGHPSKAMYNPGSWGGWALALDTTRPDVLDHLRETYAALSGQGFDYHKIDFCYAAALPAAERHDRSATRAEALRRGLDAVRDGIGDDAFLLGCGCPFGPAVGAVDAMRVSADVAPTWEPDAHWPGLPETAPSARNAIAASVLRAPLHRRVFLNDPDCVLLRPTGTGLDAHERSVLRDVVAGTGAFVVFSDDLSRYTDDEWRAVQALRESQPRLDTELDLVDPFATCVEVRAANRASSFTVDWTAPSSRLVVR